MKRFAPSLVVASLIALQTGCSSLYLHNKEDDVAATSAKTDYDASKITEVLKAERSMVDGLEAKEVEAFRKVTQSERNLVLLSLVNESGTTNQGPRRTAQRPTG